MSSRVKVELLLKDGQIMTTGSTMTLPADRDVLAPDGSEVRVLLSLAGGSMAHFQLAAGQVSRAVRHRSVEEIWYVLSGAGEMWRSHGGREDVAALSAGVCLTIPVGVRFQFRAAEGGPLAAVAVTMPPWPGDHEAEAVPGKWQPTVGNGR
jgi:mannose-6-phosphate isomerase-like protein (cupin superfamily)